MDSGEPTKPEQPSEAESEASKPAEPEESEKDVGANGEISENETERAQNGVSDKSENGDSSESGPMSKSFEVVDAGTALLTALKDELGDEDRRLEQLAELNRVLNASSTDGTQENSGKVWIECTCCKDPVQVDWDVCPGCKTKLQPNSTDPQVNVDNNNKDPPQSTDQPADGREPTDSPGTDGSPMTSVMQAGKKPSNLAEAEHARRVSACRSKPPSLRSATNGTPGRKESRVSFQENLEETFPISNYIAEANENEAKENEKAVSSCCSVM